MARNIKSKLRDYIIQMSYERETQGGQRITQNEIADATGVSQPTISVWMDPNRPLKRIDTTAWLALSDYLGVKPEELLMIEDAENPEKRSLHRPARELQPAV